MELLSWFLSVGFLSVEFLPFEKSTVRIARVSSGLSNGVSNGISSVLCSFLKEQPSDFLPFE